MAFFRKRRLSTCDVGGRDVGPDSPARSECGQQRHAARLSRGDQIVEDLIGNVLVKNAFVTKALQIEFEAL